MKTLAIVALCVCFAVTYGVIHDQIISPPIYVQELNVFVCILLAGPMLRRYTPSGGYRSPPLKELFLRFFWRADVLVRRSAVRTAVGDDRPPTNSHADRERTSAAREFASKARFSPLHSPRDLSYLRGAKLSLVFRTVVSSDK
jgi:hypothetical protein